MATITLRIRIDRLTSKGEAPLELLVFHGGKNRQISLKRRVKPEYWDDVRKRVKGADPKERQITNSIIVRETSKLQGLIDKMVLKGENINLDELIELYRGKRNELVSLIDYMEHHIEQNPDNLQYGTIKYYKTCLEKIRKFSPKVKLTEVDEHFLSRFEKHLLKSGNGQNTVFNRLKVIRKLMRVAKREGRIERYPFEFYKVKTEETKRDFLSVEELKRLIDLDNLPPSHIFVRDIYVFSAVAGGMRFGDICTLRKEAIIDRNGSKRIEFRNAKTDEYISFKLPALALQIIQKYQNAGPYVFPIIREDKELMQEISRRNAYFNKVLKILATKAGIDKKITMHTARHTWATISLTHDIQTEVVGKILGHKDLKTTQIYTNILDQRKDDAMDKWDNIVG